MDDNSLLSSSNQVGSSSSTRDYMETVSENFMVELSVHIKQLGSILTQLKDNHKLMEVPQIRNSINSLETQFLKATSTLLLVNNSKPQIQDITHDLGRSIGLVLFATHDDVPGVSTEMITTIKEKMESLRRQLMDTDFAGTEEEANEIVEEDVRDIDDVVLKLKYGSEDEFNSALLDMKTFVQAKINRRLKSEWNCDEGLIRILFNRLGSSKPHNRLIIIQILTSLALIDAGNKDKMADNGYLSLLVKSLARNTDEQREAVGLLLRLSEVPAIRRRLGRIQGCILMLVAILNGDNRVAMNDAGRLLNLLSSSTQNALHMAEAGYFNPLVHYLKQGSDMSKILMATALSRMEITDQSKDSLGEAGAIEPLVKMFNDGKLEAKLSSLGALHNLTSLKQNIQRLINTGVVASLLQLLFSVTSVLMTLREPASAILARVAQSESILVNQDIAHQMLSLLNISSPVIQLHLLQALNSISNHPSAAKVRKKIKENGAVQLLLPFLSQQNTKIRTTALDLIYSLSEDVPVELGEDYINLIISILPSPTATESEKASAVGILSNLAVSDKKATDMIRKANLVPTFISMMNSWSNSTSLPVLAESIAGVVIRLTPPSDKKLQSVSVEQGAIILLLRLLKCGSPLAVSRAATSLAQLSQNSLSLRRPRKSQWFCGSPPCDAFCEVHNGYCSVRSTFCLVKAGVIPLLVEILGRDKGESDEAVLTALATILQDETWENGSNVIARTNMGVETVIKVLERGRSVKSQEKAMWMLERIFRVEDHRVEYGESAQAVLIDVAQKGDSILRPVAAKLLAQLDLLQLQSTYF